MTEPKDHDDFTKRLEMLASHETDNFIELTRVSGLDPTSDFIGADLRGVDLRGLDLSEYDFTNADMEGALIDGTVFQDGMKENINFQSSVGRKHSPSIMWRTKKNTDRNDIPRQAHILIERLLYAGRQEERISALHELTGTYLNKAWLKPILQQVMLKDKAHKPSRTAYNVLHKLNSNIATKNGYHLCILRNSLSERRIDYTISQSYNHVNNEEVCAALIELTKKDITPYIKRRILTNLAKNFTWHPKAIGFLFDFARNNTPSKRSIQTMKLEEFLDYDFCMSDILFAIASTLTDSKHVIPLLIEYAQDGGPWSKSSAFSGLAENYKRNNLVFSFFMKAACDGKNERDAPTIVQYLAEDFSDRTEVAQLLTKLSQGDPDSKLTTIAKNAISKS